MESLNALIQTYIHNLSIFYCKDIDTDDNGLKQIIEDLNEYIKEMIGDV